MENVSILVMLFDKEGMDEKVVTQSQLLKVCVPSSGTAESLFHAITDALRVIGVESISLEDCKKLVLQQMERQAIKGLVES